MERFLKPEKFDSDPDLKDAGKSWAHWYKTFTNFLTPILEQYETTDKLAVLVCYLSPNVFEYISEAETYDDAIKILQSLYEKPKSEIFARHLLYSRKQDASESLDQYFQILKSLAKDCNYEQVSALKHKQEAIRDAFIGGLSSSYIRQRLLEHKTLDLDSAIDQAKALERAQLQADSFTKTVPQVTASMKADLLQTRDRDEACRFSDDLNEPYVNAAQVNAKCFFCGGQKHPRFKCPARDATCHACQKKGHFSKACKSSKEKPKSETSATTAVLATAKETGSALHKATKDVYVGHKLVNALVDSGSTSSFISKQICDELKLHIYPAILNVSMATLGLSTAALGVCYVTLKYDDFVHANAKLIVLGELCSDVILGHDLLTKHSSVSFHFDGPERPLNICSFACASIEPPSLFGNLTKDCRPIADKSRCYSKPDEEFISKEIEDLLKEGIIETSKSPWRAQVVVTKSENHKKRMVIDYSRTINRYTLLDAYPLPRINDLVRKISNSSVFTTVDLKSAYHQIPLREEEKIFTAFQANGRLYHFLRVPFGVTNGVSCFQRIMDDIISKEGLHETYAYLDNITICGKDQDSHDLNVQKFYDAAKKYNLNFNPDKTVSSKRAINLLGYCISNGEIRPDPERLSALDDLKIPDSQKSLKRVLGLFSYYSQWIPKFSDKIRPLVQTKTFPLSKEAVSVFESLKKLIKSAVVVNLDPNEPLVVETDASDYAIAASLNQCGRPVAFFSRTLNKSELNHSSVEKEAYALVESIKRWRHFLLGKMFKVVTDQKSVSFMFNNDKLSKIKNEKVIRWRIELSCFQFEVVHRPGKENLVADTLSRDICCSVSTGSQLAELHGSLCHPGVSRMAHFVRSRNLPFSVEDIRKVTNSCSICAKTKPKYFKPDKTELIKATQPFERLNIDFKGPLPTISKNRYILTIIDEYSRFPFAFACPDMTSETVIKCLTSLFAIFGMPNYVHSDRGASFMSEEFKEFLTNRGIAKSQTSPYNPTGNSQCERYNGIIWKSIQLCLASRNLSITHWESVLLDALHSIRSLLCTSTNATPHERLFAYNRKSTTGCTLPSWLSQPGKVLYKRGVRPSKFDPLVDEVDLLDANQQYAFIQTKDGREVTVPTKHLAPAGHENAGPQRSPAMEEASPSDLPNHFEESRCEYQPTEISQETTKPSCVEVLSGPATDAARDNFKAPLRRSTRISRPPDRLAY